MSTLTNLLVSIKTLALPPVAVPMPAHITSESAYLKSTSRCTVLPSVYLLSSPGDWSSRTVPNSTAISSCPCSTWAPLISSRNPGCRVGVGAGVAVGLGVGVGSSLPGPGVPPSGVAPMIVGLMMNVGPGVGVSTVITGRGVGRRVGSGVTSLRGPDVRPPPWEASSVAKGPASRVGSGPGVMVSPGSVIDVGSPAESLEPQAIDTSSAAANPMPSKAVRPNQRPAGRRFSKGGAVMFSNRPLSIRRAPPGVKPNGSANESDQRSYQRQPGFPTGVVLSEPESC